jgi:hypothetical protein
MVIDTYVVGGGLSGLVYAATHPGCFVITSELSMVAKGVSPLVLHYDPDVAEWVEDVVRFYHLSSGCHVRRKTCAVEYIQDDRSCSPVLSEQLARQYFLKSRGLGNTEKVFESRLDTSFDYCDISLGELEAALKCMIGEERIIRDKVVLITDELIKTEGDCQLYYDKLVSTIPAPLFFELYRGQGWHQDYKYKFEWVTKSYLSRMREEFSIAPVWMLNHEKEGYVYIPQEDVGPEGLIRLSNVNGGQIIAEYSGSIHSSAYTFVKYGYFLRPLCRVPSPTPMIHFVGRFAEWDENIMIHNIIRRYI